MSVMSQFGKMRNNPPYPSRLPPVRDERGYPQTSCSTQETDPTPHLDSTADMSSGLR